MGPLAPPTRYRAIRRALGLKPGEVAAYRRIQPARHPVYRIVLASDLHDDRATAFAAQFAFGHVSEGPAQGQRGETQ